MDDIKRTMDNFKTNSHYITSLTSKIEELDKNKASINLNWGPSDTPITFLRQWIPIIYRGDFRLVGYEGSNGSRFFMSEPIIKVQDDGTTFKSHSKYYKLLDCWSEETFMKYFGCQNNEFPFKRFFKDFSNKVPPNWPLNLFIFSITISQHEVVTGHFPSNPECKSKIFSEVDDPSPEFDYYSQDIEKDIFHCFEEVYKIINDTKEVKDNNKRLRKDKDQIWQNCVSNMVTKFNITTELSTLLSWNTENRKYKQRSINKKPCLHIYLWYIRPQTIDDGTEAFILTGYVFNEDKEFVQYSCEIFNVIDGGRFAYSNKGPVALIGPMSSLIYDLDIGGNREIMHRIGAPCLIKFLGGLPKLWRQYSVILEIIRLLSIEIGNRADENENKPDNKKLIKEIFS